MFSTAGVSRLPQVSRCVPSGVHEYNYRWSSEDSAVFQLLPPQRGEVKRRGGWEGRGEGGVRRRREEEVMKGE